MPSTISQNLATIRKQISTACTKSGRKPEEVSILAATKGRTVDQVNEVIAAGISVCGENYLQEAEKKIAEIGSKVEWHFIGHLQSNKAKKAVELFDCIQSVDSAKLAGKINDAAEKPFPVFIEVNIGEEKTKFGVLPKNVATLFQEIKELPNLKIRGLFCMAPFVEPEHARSFFQKMKQLTNQLSLKELSMGMSNDFAIAVEEGATTIRLGTAIFGKREK
jgi:pyridoxal phosphate enzyme (YggS family)